MLHTISVIQSHLDRGTPGDCRCCPISLAIRDALDLHFYPRVFESAGAAFVSFEKLEKIRGTYELPQACWIFIADFDKNQRVKPFTFTLDIP